MKPYLILTHCVHEMVRAPQCAQAGQSLDFSKRNAFYRFLSFAIQADDTA